MTWGQDKCKLAYISKENGAKEDYKVPEGFHVKISEASEDLFC